MEELKKSTGSGGGAGWEKSFGKAKADELRQKYQSSVQSRMREIIKERKDLSSPAPTPNQDDS
jgi:hypothetical protein